MYNDFRDHCYIYTLGEFKCTFGLTEDNLIDMCKELSNKGASFPFKYVYIIDRACLLTTGYTSRRYIKIYMLMPSYSDLNKLSSTVDCMVIQYTIKENSMLMQSDIDRVPVASPNNSTLNDVVYDILTAKDIYTMLSDFKTFYKLPLVNPYVIDSPQLLDIITSSITEFDNYSYSEVISLLGDTSIVEADKGVYYLSEIKGSPEAKLIFAKPQYIDYGYEEAFITLYYLVDENLRMTLINTEDLATILDTGNLFLLVKPDIQHKPILKHVEEADESQEWDIGNLLNTSNDSPKIDTLLGSALKVAYNRDTRCIMCRLYSDIYLGKIIVGKNFINEYTTDFDISYISTTNNVVAGCQLITPKRYFNTYNLLGKLNIYNSDNISMETRRYQNITLHNSKLLLTNHDLQPYYIFNRLQDHSDEIIVFSPKRGEYLIYYVSGGDLIRAFIYPSEGTKGDYNIIYRRFKDDFSTEPVNYNDIKMLTGFMIERIITEYTKKFGIIESFDNKQQ